MDKEQAEELWNQYKDEFPPNQIDQTESLKNITQTFKMCWICGDQTTLRSITVLTSDNRRVKGIHCAECIDIQKAMGVQYIKVKPIT